MLRKDQTGYYKYWKAPLKITSHLVPQREHVERNPVEKNWKTPLNKDDIRDFKSFLSLIGTGSFNIKDEKDSIRSYVARIRSGLTNVEIDRASCQISQNLLDLNSYRLSKSIAIYFPISGEVATKSIFEAALGAEKEVYFPRVNGSSLDFYKIQNLKQLKPGSFGVLEPEGGPYKADHQQIDLFIIPGLAFDRSGNRLGYGKGYYDRALIGVPDSKKVGICYGFQVLESVPTTEHDQKVGTVITEGGIVFSRRNLGG